MTNEISLKMPHGNAKLNFNPTVNYTDFKGFGHDDNLGTFSFKPNRSEVPFPPCRQSGACRLSLQPSTACRTEFECLFVPTQKLEHRGCICKIKPILGGRLKSIQESEENSQTVVTRDPRNRAAELPVMVPIWMTRLFSQEKRVKFLIVPPQLVWKIISVMMGMTTCQMCRRSAEVTRSLLNITR
jgi:hypothetical protein